MNYSEIIKLLDAGYTREEIMSMSETTDPNIEETKEEPKKEEPDTSGSNTEETEVNNEFTKALQEMKEMFTGFKNELQAMNIMNSQLRDPDLNDEDLIANIINPFEREK